MTITEAAAAGTPAVVTRIAGHHDAVADGRSGLLVEGRDGLVDGARPRAARRGPPGSALGGRASSMPRT